MKRIVVDGVELAVVEQGKGVPLLLVHGFPLDHSMWAGQIEGLGDICRVIAPDLRGFGQSEVTEGTQTMAQMADDLAGLLDGLGVEEPVVLCGLSMGGYVAWEFYRRHRDRLRGLVLCDTRAACDTPMVAHNRRDTAAKVAAEGPQVLEDMVEKLFSQSTLANNPQMIEQTRQVIRNAPAQGVAAAAFGMAQRIDATSLLPEIDCPALVIVGEEDVISPVAEMQTIANAIPGASLVTIPQAGHISPLEQPAAVNDAIRGFVTR